MGAQEGNHHCLAMLLCRAVRVLARWACPTISRTAMSRSKANLFFSLCALSSVCVAYWNLARFETQRAGTLPSFKSASRSAPRVDMESLKDSMNGVTESAGQHLQDVSWVSMDDIVVRPIIVVV